MYDSTLNVGLALHARIFPGDTPGFSLLLVLTQGDSNYGSSLSSSQSDHNVGEALSRTRAKAAWSCRIRGFA